jgi:leucyl/phenylalanyl-tRNA---protein transferase
MPVARFPDPRSADEQGLVAIGGDLHPETLLLAYRNGIFPWPVTDLPMLWFSPPQRAILDFDAIHVPRSLRPLRRRPPFRLTIDRAFAAVIGGCAEAPRPGQDGTWITPELATAYVRLHRLGIAHSAEAWLGDELVGGLYGVDVDGAFGAESMFYLAPNASKLALLHLVDHLRERGLDWIDIQMMTPHMRRLGANTIAREEFLQKLAATRARGLELF